MTTNQILKMRNEIEDYILNDERITEYQKQILLENTAKDFKYLTLDNDKKWLESQPEWD